MRSISLPPNIWSGSNQLTIRMYYLNTLKELVFLKRAMEEIPCKMWPRGVAFIGEQHINGKRQDELQIHDCHLDGRLAMRIIT
jgi:hypothetical protein